MPKFPNRNGKSMLSKLVNFWSCAVGPRLYDKPRLLCQEFCCIGYSINAQKNSALCQTELVEVRKKRHEIATTMTTCEEKLRKPEWQLDALNEELHQFRDCKKHWERIFNDTLNKGVFNVSNQGVCSNQFSNFFKN